MKTSVACVAGIAALLVSMTAPRPARGAELSPPGIDIATWPLKRSPEFGCYLEKTFGHRDKRFNCALKNYKNKGDPCKNTTAYYEGPVFPDKLIAKVHPQAVAVNLEWSGGQLREVSVTIKGTWNEADARKAFRLPSAEQPVMPDNVSEVSFGYARIGLVDETVLHTAPSDPAVGETSVTLSAFPYMGAADLDCASVR